MIRKTGKLWLCHVGMLAGILGSLSAGEFMPPAEGPVPFRRDRIPLTADAMNTLSRDLRILARENKAMDAPVLRGAAQMLALALALNPTNSNAQELVSEYKEGRHSPAENDEQKNHRKIRIRRLIAWLETPQAGTDGRALADCLKDILVITDSQPSQTEAARNTTELGAWAGWVPDVSAFQTKAIESTPKPKDPDPVAVVKPPTTNGILLETATVLTSIWRRGVGQNHSEVWVSVLAPLQMTATKEPRGEGGGFSIIIGNHQDLKSPDLLGKTLERLLRNQHGSLPPVGQIRITSVDVEQSTQLGKPQSISAAASVLASAAITGHVPEAIVIGKIDASGAFTLPSQFWDRLQTLGKGNGRRLVLPADAIPYLSSILAMEKPEFFLEYEVLVAADFKNLLDLCAKSPEEPLATAAAKFREIRKRAGTQDVRAFIGENFEKQQLAAVLHDQPSHISAKMLLTQALGNRPILVSRKVLAAEIRRALEPMAWIKTSGHFVFNTEKEEWPSAPRELAEVNQAYEICRLAVDRLERYTSRDDLPLLEEARDLVFSIRSLHKAPRLRSSNNWAIIGAVRSAHQDMVRRQDLLAARLTKEAQE